MKETTSQPELVIEAGRTEKQYWQDLWRDLIEKVSIPNRV